MSHIGVVFYNQKVTPHWSSNTTFLVVWNSNSDLISNTVFLPRNHQNRQHMVLKGGWETKVGDGMGNIKFRKIIHKGGINIPENLAPLCPSHIRAIWIKSHQTEWFCAQRLFIHLLAHLSELISLPSTVCYIAVIKTDKYLCSCTHSREPETKNNWLNYAIRSGW